MGSILPEFYDLLKSLCGISNRPIKLFYFIQNDFWDSYNEKKQYSNIIDKFISEIGNNGLINEIFDLIASQYTIRCDDGSTYEINLSLELVLPSIDFLMVFIDKIKNTETQTYMFHKLERTLDEYFQNFNEKDANNNDITLVFQLLQLREQLDSIFKRLKLKTTFDIISFEDLKIQLIFYFLREQNFTKQLTVANILNHYNSKKIDKNLSNHIKKIFIQKKVIEMLFGDYCNEELVKNIVPFLEYIASAINYENLLKVFEIKAKSNQSKEEQIDRVLLIFAKHINVNVI